MKVYHNNNDIMDEMKNNWNSNVQSLRIWGFITSVLMVTVGILCAVYPVEATYFVDIMAAIVMMIFGFWEIIRFIERPAFLKMGAGLASGVLNILLSISLLTSPREDVLAYFGFLLGLDLLMLGIDQLTSVGRLKVIGVKNTGWMIADGILNILAGLVLLILPIASITVISITLSVYLILGGVDLFIICIQAKNLKIKKPKQQ